MVEAAERAVAEVMPALKDSGEWAGEIMRYTALLRVSEGMEEVCAPRHRRIAADDLTKARADLQAFAAELASADLSGEWVTAGGMTRIPGVGPAKILARVSPGASDPRKTAAGLLEGFKRMDRCRGGEERLLQAGLIDVGSSEVVFMGIFFEEQLICEGMVPGVP